MNPASVEVTIPQASTADRKANKNEDGKNLNVEFKIKTWERAVFSLLDVMIKDFDLSPALFTFLLIVQELQLFSISWRSDLLMNEIPRWILSPLMWLAESFTLAIHIASWAFLAIFISSLAYCAYCVSTAGQVKRKFALTTLQYTVLLMKTILFLPIAQTFLIPVNCVGNSPDGYSDLQCNGGSHYALLASGAIGGLVLIVSTLVFSGLFFDAAPRSQFGQRQGFFDQLYIVARIILIVMYQVVTSATTAQAVNLVILFLLAAFAFKSQVFFHERLNNIRFGFFSGAMFLAGTTLAFSFFVKKENEWIFLGIGLGVYAVTAVAGFFANSFLVGHIRGKILRQIDHYNSLLMNPELEARISQGDVQDVNKSYLEIICQQATDISGRFAVKQEIKAFPSPEWVDVAVRFIIHSYMDKDAVILANQMFSIAFRQFPKEKSLYLTYIAYIRSFFTFLHGEEYELLMILLKKHTLDFNDRCLVYYYQQSISQTANSDEDEELNYAAFMEYQSLEKQVKEAHVRTLGELRDFWTAVRSNESVPRVSRRVTRLSQTVESTNDLYETIIKRFPDTRNMMLLYSRFLLKVLNDKDKALIYQNNGDRLEATDDNDHNSEVDQGPAVVKESEAIEKRSEGQSSRTSASKEARLQRQKRELLTARLAMPVQDFMRRIKFFSCLFVLLLVATIAICKISLDNTKGSLDRLLVTIVPRKFTWIVYTEIRSLQYSSDPSVNKPDLFKYNYDDLKKKDEIWKDSILPVFSTNIQSKNKKPMLIWNALTQSHTIEEMNAYEASERVYQSLDSVIAHKTKDWQTLFNEMRQEKTSYRVDFRFFFDNIENIYALFNDECTSAAEAFASSVNVSVVIIGLLGGSTLLVLLGAGLVLPYVSFDAIYDFKNRVIQLFYKIPRSMVLEMITEYEEEIEVLSGEDEELNSSLKTVTSDDHRKGQEKTPVLHWSYISLWSIIFAAVGVLLGLTLYFVLLTQYVPLTFSLSDRRRADTTEKIYALGVEAYFADETTWTSYSATAAMRMAVDELRSLHDTVNKNLLPFLDGQNELFKILRIGTICHTYRLAKYENNVEKTKKEIIEKNRLRGIKPSNVSDEKITENMTQEQKDEYALCKLLVDQENYFTWDTITSSVDTNLLRVMDEATLFLDEKGYILDKNRKEETGYENPRLRLLGHLAAELGNTSLSIQKAIFTLVTSLDEFFTIIIFSMFAIALVFGAFAYIVGYSRKSAESERDHGQLISLLYVIPIEERKKVPELNTFVESGGAILL